MLTRKKVSKRKILRVLSETGFNLTFYKNLATTALVALHNERPKHIMFQGAEAITVYRASLKRQREDRLSFRLAIFSALAAIITCVSIQITILLLTGGKL